MRQKPKALTYLALLFFGIAIGFPLQIIFMFGFPSSFDEARFIVHRLTDLNMACASLSVLAGALSLRASRYTIKAIALTSVLFLINNFVVGWSAKFLPQVKLESVLGASLGYLILLKFLLDPMTLAVLRDPKLQWWRTAKRISIALPVHVTVDDFTHSTVTVNLSETGVLISLNELFKTRPLRIGQAIELGFDGALGLSLRCKATVIRKLDSVSSNTQQDQVGLRFESLPKPSQKILKQLILLQSTAQVAP